MIRQGDVVAINNDLGEVMFRLGFDDDTCSEFQERFAGTRQTVYAVWQAEDGVRFATIDLCTEIPLECCVEGL